MIRFIDPLARQSLARYQEALVAWAAKVERMPQPIDALRIAAFPPAPDAVISSRPALTRLSTERARIGIARVLMAKVDDLDPDDPDVPQILRLSDGRWPDLHRRLVARSVMAHPGPVDDAGAQVMDVAAFLAAEMAR